MSEKLTTAACRYSCEDIYTYRSQNVDKIYMLLSVFMEKVGGAPTMPSLPVSWVDRDRRAFLSTLGEIFQRKKIRMNRK